MCFYKKNFSSDDSPQPGTAHLGQNERTKDQRTAPDLAESFVLCASSRFRSASLRGENAARPSQEVTPRHTTTLCEPSSSPESWGAEGRS